MPISNRKRVAALRPGDAEKQLRKSLNGYGNTLLDRVIAEHSVRARCSRCGGALRWHSSPAGEFWAHETPSEHPAVCELRGEVVPAPQVWQLGWSTDDLED